MKISDIAVLQKPVAILQNKENRPIPLPNRTILLFQVINKFSRCHSCDLQEIPPCSRSLTIADMVEKFMNISPGISFHSGYNIVYTALGKILDEGHSRVSFESLPYICTIRLQQF